MIARRACGLLARIGLQYSMRALARSTPRSGPRALARSTPRNWPYSKALLTEISHQSLLLRSSR